MNEVVIFGVSALTLICIYSALIAVLILRTLARAFLTIDRLEKSRADQLQEVLDRLMTIKWEDFVNLRTTVEAEEGGFFPPEESAEVKVEEPSRWGALTRAREADEALTNEQALLAADFPEDEK